MAHRCEWPAARCMSTNTKLAEFQNYWGRTVRHWLCDSHLAEMSDKAGMQKRIDNALQGFNAIPTVLTPEQLEAHPAHIALREHQQMCDACASVRDWTAEEVSEGRVKDEADVGRIGKYTMEHCCPEGVRLNRAVGLARLGLPES